MAIDQCTISIIVTGRTEDQIRTLLSQIRARLTPNDQMFASYKTQVTE